MLRVDTSGGKIAITKGEEKEKPSSQSPSAASSPTSLFSAPSSPEISLQSQLPLPTVVAAAPPPPRPKKTPATAPLKTFRRGPNPHMKILDMPSGAINTGTGISTKQRIAQGALQPTKPTAPPPAPNSRANLPQLKTSSNSLASLNFKKTTATTPLTAAGNTFTSHDAQKTPLSPHAQPSTNILNDMSIDLSSDVGNYVHVYSSNAMLIPDSTSISSQAGYSRQHTTGHMMTETEPFLGNIVPAGQATPLIPASRANNSPAPPFSLQRKPSLPVRIPKKWKWSGPLHLHHTGATKMLCNVAFYDLSEPRPMGLRFPVVINSMEKLELLSFHNAADMGTFLSACRCSDQVARLGPKDAQDVSLIETLIKYMDKHQKVALIPISLDSNLVGHILLFPRSIERLSSAFRIPSELLVKGSLIATLLPWKLTPSQVAMESRKPATLLIPSHTRLQPTLESPRWIRAIRTKLTYQHALHVLKFPLELHTFLSSRERPFCIWYEVGDGSKQNAGFETMLLYSIMEQCRASNVGKKADVRVVFVHVGALDTLHRLPALMERRAKTPHLRFYTYGTHESIMPEHWGIREIYPRGGVVTFTPTAILEDPMGTINRIRQLNQHPLWACYIHPSVLGIISTLCCKGRDPVSVLESGEFRYRNLLMAIERGEVALLHAPPSPLKHVKPNDRKAWILAYSLCKNLNARKSLEFALDVFRVKFANLQESEWASAMVKLLLLDLSSMQRQPAIMSEHRRYVILHGEQDRKHIPVDPVNRYGLEWVTADKFDFKDEFFPKQ
ncbi:hypothetical protein BDQ12DRAFT_678640 [Crucibulum laeve]|uniref:Uncharacterized protein n=1 Tax=Crucibulum laeve TaxID=68775 RepID=A0A5C3M6A3_9AGAR|nr:hypothetical protein BDQ12DRAFT_678640 [Crucibulum laeve]